MPEEEEELVEIGRYASVAEAHEHGLVVLSAGESYWLEREWDTVRLLVVSEEADFLEGQVRLYERESAYWPPVEPEVTEHPTGMAVVLWWTLLLVVGYGASFRWPEMVEWGRVSAEAVVSGELYRVGTALFLHADVGHLAGNVLIGGFFLFFAARVSGAWLALGGSLVAGAVGNWVNVQLHLPEPHFSIGASTAVFGTVGWLVAYPLGNGSVGAGRRWLMRVAVPLLAGLALLALLGTGTAFTDTSAHLTGFGSGVILGGGMGMIRRIFAGKSDSRKRFDFQEN